jgi:hypothetical protein
MPFWDGADKYFMLRKYLLQNNHISKTVQQIISKLDDVK